MKTSEFNYLYALILLIVIGVSILAGVFVSYICNGQDDTDVQSETCIGEIDEIYYYEEDDNYIIILMDGAVIMTPALKTVGFDFTTDKDSSKLYKNSEDKYVIRIIYGQKDKGSSI